MFDGAERPLTDHDLARLCLVAEPRRKIYGAAVSGVFATMLEADLAERCIARSDSNSESENMTLPGPLFRQIRRLFPHIAKAEASPTGSIRGRRNTMLSDADINYERHARAAVGAVIASVTFDPAIFVSGGTEHQCGPGESPITAIVRI